MGRDDESAKLERCEVHGLAFDPAIHGGCVLCRTPASPEARTPRRAKVVVALVLLGAVAAFGYVLWRRVGAEDGSASEGAHGGARLETLRVVNAAGRHGTYYLPAGFEAAPRPLLVLFHGTGGDGAGIVDRFVGAASARKLILLAPDSRRSPDGALTWQVGDSGELTPDFEHTQAALAELLALPGVRVDPDRVLAAGYSGGGSSAPYVATQDPRFKAFAVLHGGVFPGGLGTNRVPGWFSTGDDDSVRTPVMVRAAAESVGTKAASVHVRTFPGAHDLSTGEIDALLDWWLGAG